jgi:hypothetical protein
MHYLSILGDDASKSGYAYGSYDGSEVGAHGCGQDRHAFNTHSADKAVEPLAGVGADPVN